MAKIPVHPMICGIDAGGSHTRYRVFDTQGNTVLAMKRPSMHFMKVGFAGITEELNAAKAAMAEAGIETSTLKVAIGIAGYGADIRIRQDIEQAIHAVFPEARIMNDAMLGMIAALQHQDGVYVIAGTGSIAFKKRKKQLDRKGGFGYLLGDEGSAFWIGKEILRLFTHEVDNLDQRTRLYERVMHHFALGQGYEIIALANQQRNYRNWVAGLAEIMVDISETKVQEIYKNAGIALADLANSFAVTEPALISIGGSVLLKNHFVRNMFLDNLDDNYVYIEPHNSAEYAALYLFSNEK